MFIYLFIILLLLFLVYIFQNTPQNIIALDIKCPDLYKRDKETVEANDFVFEGGLGGGELTHIYFVVFL